MYINPKKQLTFLARDIIKEVDVCNDIVTPGLVYACQNLTNYAAMAINDITKIDVWLSIYHRCFFKCSQVNIYSICLLKSQDSLLKMFSVRKTLFKILM